MSGGGDQRAARTGATPTDYQQIAEVTSRMGVLADARDWQGLRTLYTDTVAVDYTSLAGGEPATLSGDEMVAAWRIALEGLDASQHLIANHQVDVDGDEATASPISTRCTGWQRRTAIPCLRSVGATTSGCAGWVPLVPGRSPGWWSPASGRRAISASCSSPRTSGGADDVRARLTPA